MSEFNLYVSDKQTQAQINHEQLQASHEAFADALVGFSETIPEISKRMDQLTAAGTELIDVFGVRPEFFEDHNQALLFASLAGNAASLSDKENLSYTEQVKRREFIADATFLLTKDHTYKFEDLIARHQSQRRQDTVELPDQEQERIYDKYTDPELTSAVSEKIEKDGLFKDVIEKLGISADEASQVKLHVLSIGSGSEPVNFDWRTHGFEWREVSDWAKGLENRAANFADELQDPTAELAARAAGFAVHIGDKEHIFIPMGAAEIILADERGIELAKDWNPRPEGILGTLKHEYVHTNNNERVAKEFGFSVEEIRAEYFSGNTGEYFDVKKFFTNLAIFRGVHIRELFDANAETRRNGKEHGIWDMLAETYGLNTLVKIAAAMPRPYVRYEKSEFVQGMLSSLGSYEQVAEDYGKNLSDKEKQEAAERVTKVLESTKANNGNMDAQLDWLHVVTNALKYDTSPYESA